MKASPASAIGKTSRLAIVAMLLAACSTTTTVPLAGQAGAAAASADLCEGKDPAKEARDTQGKPPYLGVDAYANVVAQEGMVFYSLTPGNPPRFAVTEETLRDAAGSWKKYYELVQVTTDPGVDTDGKPRKLREAVQAYHLTEHLCVARGTALANKDFGSGGGTQYYISPADSGKLRPGKIAPITQWAVAGGKE
jgi:hypothetical protein